MDFEFRPHIIFSELPTDSSNRIVDELKERGFKVLARDNYLTRTTSLTLSLEPRLFYKFVLADNLDVKSQLIKYTYEVT